MLWTTRYCVSLILLILLLCKAGTTGAQPSLLDRKVTLNVTGQPVGKVLQQITQKTGVRFSYDPDLLNTRNRVTIRESDKTLKEILDILFDDPNVSLSEIGNQVVVYYSKKYPLDNNPTQPAEQKSTEKQPQIDGNRQNAEPVPAPDTVYLTRKDTIILYKRDTLTLVKTEILVQHDTIVRTDTVYISKTQKPGKTTNPHFDKNSIRNQRFREHNGWYAGLSYGHLIGKAAYSGATSSAGMLEIIKGSSSPSPLNFSLEAFGGYDYYRIGLRSGLSYTRLGESFEYSFTKQVGGYYRTDTVEAYYTLSGVDTNWYYVTDSSWVNIDYKKFTYKNPNAYRYIEIPIVARFRVIQGELADVYLLSGLIAGFSIGQKALLIQSDEENTVDWIGKSHLKPVMISWQAGLGASYYPGNGIGVFAEASYRGQFTPQLKNYPFEKKFRFLNIKTGIFVKL